MEVLLKKTKITKSIFNQMQTARSKNLKSYKILGFCLLSESKWVLLYDEKTSTPFKYEFMTNIFKGVIEEDQHGYTPPHPHYVSMYSNSTYKLPLKTEQEAKDICQTLIDTMEKASELGQIFL